MEDVNVEYKCKKGGGGGGLRVGAILGSLASPLLGAVAQQVEENVDVAKWKIIFGEV